MARATTPFSGLTVLDFSRYLPGGYATQILADLGATVIKCEDTGAGDFMRHDYPTMGGGISYYITALGRNKKSMSMNLKDKEVVDWFLKIAKDADVIVESFRPGVTKKLGIDYDTVKEINPGIIYCSISAYGAEDPRSLKAQHDLNMQATSGYLSVNHGSTSPLHLCDLSSGMVAGQAILAALYAREQTGKGTFIDTSMFDCFVWWNSLLDSRWCFNGGQCYRDDLEYPSTAYNVYETKDGGKLALGMVEPKFWEPFCDAIGHPEIKPDGLKRRWEAPESFKIVEDVIKSKTTDEWMEWLKDKDFCIAKVNSKTEAVEQITRENPEALAWVDFPRVGRVLQTGLPHHLSTVPVNIADFEEVSPLGADTAEFFKKAGCDDETIARLKEKGSIRLGDDIEAEEDRVPLYDPNK